MAEHFEAKKHAYRQTQDGVVISFVCHPNDVAKMLTLAPLGTRYMVAVEEIGDDEKPTGGVTQLVESGDAHECVGSSPTAPRRKFYELPLSQQAAMRCNDTQFWKFIGRSNENDAAQYVRNYCQVESRSKIGSTPISADRWTEMELDYQRYLTDQRYAHVMRK